MGRRSLAEIILDQIPEYPDEESQWIVLYDFRDMKPNPNFWKNLDRVKMKMGDGHNPQFSVFLTNKRKAAIAAARLARHYKAEVLVYKVQEQDSW
ncbi:MAG: hypothetical protein NWE89_13515 [Candidatus Bathyarchaeota archaeon]|nr:hypothetical protein [Candidatus Bathyarchaeota archaeon]